MSEVILYIAVSLDGFIVALNEEVLFQAYLPLERLTLSSHQRWENGFVQLEYQ